MVCILVHAIERCTLFHTMYIHTVTVVMVVIMLPLTQNSFNSYLLILVIIQKMFVYFSNVNQTYDKVLITFFSEKHAVLSCKHV